MGPFTFEAAPSSFQAISSLIGSGNQSCSSIKGNKNNNATPLDFGETQGGRKGGMQREGAEREGGREGGREEGREGILPRLSSLKILLSSSGMNIQHT